MRTSLRHAIWWTISIIVAAELRAVEPPLFPGLGNYSRKVTTESRQAQKYFDQGLAFLHGFNHSAAIRSFRRAAELDPNCAMAFWGAALAYGPHINFPTVSPEAADQAWKQLELAKQSASKAAPVEAALIHALEKRYANPQPQDRAPLDRAYADAMRELWKEYPDDPDVGALFAEALMDLRPWDQWTLSGEAQPGTDEIIATLEAVLKRNPDHPLANHLYIHALEPSPFPERADEAARRLPTLQPGLGHSVHMASHIDIRRGRWEDAISVNLEAIESDRRYRVVFGSNGFFPWYAMHNRHMLAYVAMMSGQRELAMKQIRAMVAEVPPAFLKENAMVTEGFMAMPLEVMVRFGMWDEILKEPDRYRDQMPFTRAFHHAARAIAYAAKRDPANARKAQAVFIERAALVPKDDYLGNNSAEAILGVVRLMLDGEILVAEGKIDEGLRQLQNAVAQEDNLKYDEPPGWLIPVRHSLGAVLMNQGRFAEAEKVYREDLARIPDNGWSLFGLAESLRRQAKAAAEVDPVAAGFDKVWAKADVKIANSCLCQPTLR